MQYIEFKVQHQTITRTDTYKVVANSQNYLRARFRFCEEWAGLTQTAVFSTNSGKHYSALIENGECLVPWEVLCVSEFWVGVFAGDRITTTTAQVSVKPSVKLNAEPGLKPSPTAYERLVEIVAVAAKEATESATAAELSEENAEKSEMAAAESAAQAATSEQNAATAEQSATASATSALEAANRASASKGLAEQAARAAAVSERNAATAEQRATASASNAQESANHASQSASNAETSATHAEQSASQAYDSAQRIENMGVQATTLHPDSPATVEKQSDKDGITLSFGIPCGKSAYQYAVDSGYTGTEKEFMQKLAAEAGVFYVADGGTPSSVDMLVFDGGTPFTTDDIKLDGGMP